MVTIVWPQFKQLIIMGIGAIAVLVILILRNILSFCIKCGYDVDSKYRGLNVKNKLKQENNAYLGSRSTF
jgi:hypothetical protein